jgi:hypothetical protein
MKNVLPWIAGALSLLAVGCAGTLMVDGYEAAYVDVPAGYDRYPRYEHHGAPVYEISGRYYRQYNNRWVVYRERPRDLREDHR